MELGNAIFGNSRGNYPLERHVGFEAELCRLFKAYDGEDYSSYGPEFDNEVFTVRSY